MLEGLRSVWINTKKKLVALRQELVQTTIKQRRWDCVREYKANDR